MLMFIICVSSFIHSTFAQQVTKLSTPVTQFAAATLWDDCTQSVYFIDFLATGTQPCIFRYDNEKDRTYSAYIEGYESPSYVMPISEKCNENKNLFLCGIGHTNYLLQWDGKSSSARVLNPVFSAEENDPTSLRGVSRPNEHGQFFGGTFHASFCSGPNNASIYRYTKEKGLQRIVSGVQTTTGFAFDRYSECAIAYHLNSCNAILSGFEEDSNGDICNGRVVFDFKSLSSNPTPNGLALDNNGMLYTGMYTEGSVWRFNPKSKDAVQIAKLPKGIGGVTFGGKDWDILFVNVGSSIIDIYSGQVAERTSTDTSLYKITGLGVRGRPYGRLCI